MRDHLLCIRERTELLAEAVALSTDLSAAGIRLPHFSFLLQVHHEETTVSTLKSFKDLEEGALEELQGLVRCKMLKKAVEPVIELLADRK